MHIRIYNVNYLKQTHIPVNLRKGLPPTLVEPPMTVLPICRAVTPLDKAKAKVDHKIWNMDATA